MDRERNSSDRLLRIINLFMTHSGKCSEFKATPQMPAVCYSPSKWLSAFQTHLLFGCLRSACEPELVSFLSCCKQQKLRCSCGNKGIYVFFCQQRLDQTWLFYDGLFLPNCWVTVEFYSSSGGHVNKVETKYIFAKSCYYLCFITSITIGATTKWIKCHENLSKF